MRTKQNPFTLELAFDAEWGPNQEMICLTACNEEIKIFVVFPDMIEDRVALSAHVKEFNGILVEMPQGSTPIKEIIKVCEDHYNKRIDNLVMPFFYSPLDVVALLGETDAVKLFMNKFSTHKKRIYLPNYKVGHTIVKVDDVGGWGKDTLEGNANSVGIPIGVKSVISKEEKENMILTFNARLRDCVNYALNDSVITYKYYIVFPKAMRNTIKKYLDVDMPEIKKTNGALVASAFSAWIDKEVQGTSKEFKDAFNLVSAPTSDKSKSENTPYSSARISNLGALEHQGCFSSVVIGGRCNNEVPEEIKHKHVADIDLSSCYGSALGKLNYPIGMVTTFSAPNDSQLTLKDFLNQYGHELVDDLFQIIVKTKEDGLGFSQDLVYSKDVSEREIRKAVQSNFESPPGRPDMELKDVNFKHIPGQTMLLRNELWAGVITCHDLEAIRKVSTNQELNLWMNNLLVMGAAYYPKSLRTSNVSEWIEKVNKDTHLSSMKTQIRSKAWFTVPLSGYINPLIAARKIEKKLMISDPANIGEHSAKQKMIKLLINTLYGDLASIYFSFSNAILANNITSKARLGVWMLAKSMGLKQTITDGGLYSMDTVPTSPIKRGYRAGFQTLSNNNLNTAPFAGLNWKDKFKEYASKTPDQVGSELDKIMSQHVADFWKPYDMSLQFDIEHKGDNTSWSAVTMCKAHYGLRTLWGKEVYKIRGKESAKDNPVKSIMSEILNDNNAPNVSLEYTQRKMVRLGVFKKDCHLVNGVYSYNILPGVYKEYDAVQRLNNSHFPIPTLIEGRRRYGRRFFDHGKKTKFFEKYLPKGLEVFLMEQITDTSNR